MDPKEEAKMCLLEVRTATQGGRHLAAQASEGNDRGEFKLVKRIRIDSSPLDKNLPPEIITMYEII